MYKEHYQDFVLKSLKYIEENLKNPISVEQVCQEINLSPWQFQRVFKVFIGNSIGSYLRARRLTEAFKIIVKDSNSKIVDLSFEFQFNSHEAFSRSFKSFFGIRPKEARMYPNLFSEIGQPPINQNQMIKIWESISEIHTDIEYGPISLIGIEKEINSPFTNEDEFQSETVLFWQEFIFEIKKSQLLKSEFSTYIGVALNTKDEMISSKMKYFASKNADDFKSTPLNFKKIEISKNVYATFKISSHLDDIKAIVDFVYGIWLPSSNFKRSHGYDLEQIVLDHNSKSGKVNYTYMIPIEKS